MSPQEGTPDFKCQGWSNGGKNLNPKKTPTASNKPKTISGPKINPQKYPMPNFQAKFGGTFFAELCLWEYAGATTNLQIVLNTPKNNYVNQATQKNTLQISLPPTQSQNRRPETQKSHSFIPTLEIQSTPPPRHLEV